MDTISQDPEIYRMFIQMIRIVFEATPYPSLCSLRVDVLMNFHDLDCEHVCFIDLTNTQNTESFLLDSQNRQMPSTHLVSRQLRTKSKHG